MCPRELLRAEDRSYNNWQEGSLFIVLPCSANIPFARTSLPRHSFPELMYMFCLPTYHNYITRWLVLEARNKRRLIPPESGNRQKKKEVESFYPSSVVFLVSWFYTIETVAWSCYSPIASGLILFYIISTQFGAIYFTLTHPAFYKFSKETYCVIFYRAWNLRNISSGSIGVIIPSRERQTPPYGMWSCTSWAADKRKSVKLFLLCHWKCIHPSYRQSLFTRHFYRVLG